MNINNTKWKILEELSKDNKTPTELAKKLKITLPSIHIQLKQLEEKKLIKKTGEKKGKTRPYAEYSIGEGFVYFIKALPNHVERKFLPLDKNLKLHLNIWSIPQKQYHYYIEGFWWKLQDYLDDIDSIIIYGSVARGDAREGSDIDILLLVKKDVKKYQKIKVCDIGPKGKQEIIMTQIFETDSFKKLLTNNSKFAKEVLKKSIIIYDSENKFNNIKNEFN